MSPKFYSQAYDISMDDGARMSLEKLNLIKTIFNFLIDNSKILLYNKLHEEE